MKAEEGPDTYVLTLTNATDPSSVLELSPKAKVKEDQTSGKATVVNEKVSALEGTFQDADLNEYTFHKTGSYEYHKLLTGAALTIASFESALGKIGGWLVCIGIALFAFSTILGWEYHGEKAFEYLFKSHKYNMIYRIVFSLIVYVGATTALNIVWNFSDIANALMAIPNLICLLAMSGVIAKDMQEFQKVIKTERAKK